MTDGDALLKAICDHPEEDTPRLVFADWLDEQGGEPNAVWAALIRVMVRTAREPEPRLSPEESRILKVWMFYTKPWFERLGFGTAHAGWSLGAMERGFPNGLTAPFGEYRSARPRDADRVPFRELALHHVPPGAVAESIEWPELRRLRRLHFDSNEPFGDREFEAIAGCERLSGLEWLWLPPVVATDRGIEVLLSSPHLAGLRSLNFDWGGSPEILLTPPVRDRLRKRFGPTAAGDPVVHARWLGAPLDP